MIFAALLTWIAGEIRARRTMRSLESLSDEGLRDIGLSRGMIEGAARHWGGFEAHTLS
jgi:uncharacterized protein YjiS (DUF1127 family)